jgi:uncharacterized protein (TIGR00295 family)
LMMPSESECLRLLREEGCRSNIIQHVCMVKMIAVAMAMASGANMRLVTAGALLHHLGRSRTQTTLHSYEGARILRERGLPEELARVVQRHMGAGFTHEEANVLGLPEGDYMPETLEEKIVCHADNLVKGTAGIQTLREALDEMTNRGHPTSAERMRAMHRELSAACSVDVDDLVNSLRADWQVKGPCAAYIGQKDARP